MHTIDSVIANLVKVSIRHANTSLQTLVLLIGCTQSSIAATQCAPKNVVIEKAFTQLPDLHSPLAMKQAQSDDSVWYLAQRAGQISWFDNSPQASKLHPILDISAKVDTRLEMGLTGIALHPNYPKDARLFAIYNDKNHQGQSTLVSFQVNVKNKTIEANSEQVLLTLPQPATNHNGGDIHFGPDNKLYIGFGDGGRGRANAQKRNNFYGTVLRIDIDKKHKSAEYSVPKDNPFNQGQALCVSGSSANDCPEIYAYGLRNPWRFSFDRKTRSLWTGDVGESTFEEINQVESGGNYGWPTMEGFKCFKNRSCDASGFTAPIAVYGRGVGVSIVGGYVYRGKRIPALQGYYVYGDTFRKSFYGINVDDHRESNTGSSQPAHLLFKSREKISSMAQANDGELYLLGVNNRRGGDGIYRLASAQTDHGCDN
ncbi:MAG: hypothetical protein COA42_04350 [Alteromonadaceae bacterium]|nr:MAG: hypothetical protein COA42_04350 [Alteromonadaceae bacterium]